MTAPGSGPQRDQVRGTARTTALLAAVPMLASAFLPWVLLRPNRLAPGEWLGLPASAAAGLLGLSGVFLLLAWRRPNWAWVPATLTLPAALWLLGSQTHTALAGQPEFARASAASGFWVFLLGAGIALYAAQRSLPAAQRGLTWLWLLPVGLLVFTGHLNTWSVLVEGSREGARWAQELGQHLKLTGLALLFALLLGVPLAVWAAGREGVARAVLGLANAVQTVPSLALLGLLIAPLSALARAFPGLREVGVSGIGVAPALCAMTLYALLPVLRNGVVGLRGVNPGTLEAATGMGMTAGQRFWRVQLPLALPVWLTGIRQAAVMLVGVAAVAALIGAGGLGTYIFKGLQSAAADLILLGAVPATLLAVLIDGALRGLEGLLGQRLGRVGNHD
ncbi:ABC transporter permease [Deinococcus fonticola]|uniref:ABC transporter permease n=1 Tax=Deinococcus fonticola TaxID=2528713 RepID=UPI0030B8595E